MSMKSRLDQSAPTVIRQSWRVLTYPVFNHETSRLRAPVRALVPLIVTFLALAVVQGAIEARFEHKFVVGSLMGGGLLVILITAVFLSARFIDRRPIAEYGFSFNRQWLRSFAVGGLIATLVNAGTFLITLGAGWGTVVSTMDGAGGYPFVPAIVLVFASVAVAAAWEEFIFRGAILQNLAEGGDRYVPQWVAVGVAILISSVVFAFLHGGKVDQVTLYGYYLIAGLIFGVVYALTGELALPIGFHVFYNFTMTAIFGLGGTQQSPELFVLDVAGPAFWVGEEGFLRLTFAVVGGVLLVAYIRWRDGTLELNDRVPRYAPQNN